MIFELIVRNVIVRFLGVHTRFYFFKFTKRESISFDKLQGGKDEGKQYTQKFYNAIVGSVVFALFSIFIAYLVFS